MLNQINVNTSFDAGSIVVKQIDDINNLRFSIRHDTNSHFAQWFYFQLNNVIGQNLTLYLDELDKTAYPDSWDGYNICVSYDQKNWFRVPSKLNENSLTWQIQATSNSIYFAYFEPYSYLRHLELIGLANSYMGVQHLVIGKSLQQRNLDLIRLGRSGKPKVWIIARQHPGETMAEWFMEGLIKRLLDTQDPISRKLLSDYEFYLIPNMNPDGAYLGNLRTNSAGINLNREWLEPSLTNSPEVYYTRELMLANGVDVFFDIHGDEALPYVFTAGCIDNQSFSPRQQALEAQFEQIFTKVNPDYQTEYGYEHNQFSLENPTLASKWVGDKFNCLSYTIEMPFKDNANLPIEYLGWNGYRSALLGASLLTALNLMDFS
jgi:murein tripeptide amidase MpaA